MQPTTNTVQFNLMGSPQVLLGNETLTDWGPAKVQALAYYLVVEQKPVSRRLLANLLWPKAERPLARRYLSQHLAKLRRYFDPFLVVTPTTLAFAHPSKVMVDLHKLCTYLHHAKQDPR